VKKWSVTLILVCGISTSTHAWENSILIEGGIGQLKGFVQTPRGGDYNTTSERRPSFEEIDHRHDPFFHAELTSHYEKIWGFVNYFHLTPANETSLETDLLTHSRFIPATTPFEMNVHFNWYELGIGFDTAEIFSRWKIQPYLAANWLKYYYGFSSPVHDSHRNFNLLAGSAGLKVEGKVAKDWLIDAKVDITLPLTELELFEASVGLNYTFSPHPHCAIRSRASLGSLYIDYEDRQKIPNHIRYQSSPYAALGLIFLIF
jgi:hypothetical protein